jgi:hypothetical protein
MRPDDSDNDNESAKMQQLKPSKDERAAAARRAEKASQRRPTGVNNSERESTTANGSQQQRTGINNGEREPTTANNSESKSRRANKNSLNLIITRQSRTAGAQSIARTALVID